ncbi:MAG: hypothetical protein IJA85_01810 [Clostridia bacterium]|nr:hypothetical protein [Clostridia bacterium]
MKRTISLVLAALMLSTVLTACSSSEDTDKSAVTTAAPTDVTTAETTPEETRLYPDHLPDITFENADVNLGHWEYDSGMLIQDMDAEAENGDLVNDAIYKRNLAIEEKYKVNLLTTYIYLGDMTALYRKMVQAGDQTYDTIFVRAHEMPAQYNNGVLLNLRVLPHVDWTNPWWDQDSIEGLSILGGLPAIASDINLADNIATACVMFNKQVATDSNIDSEQFYNYVLDGTWTIEQMYEIGKTVSADTNGNGEADDGDLFGIVGQQDPTYILYFGSGEHYVKNDSDGVPCLAFDNERSYSVCDAIIKLMNDEKHYFTPTGKDIADVFAANKCLFMVDRLKRTELLRNMQSDYGVLPVPKYDNSQDGYSNIVSIHNATLLTIPKTNARLEMTAIILEALACESRYTVIETYYEVVLQEKLTRDAASYQMIEIIFNNRVYDLGELYALGGFNGEVLNMSLRNTAMASKYASVEKRMQKELDKLIEKAEKMIEESEDAVI